MTNVVRVIVNKSNGSEGVYYLEVSDRSWDYLRDVLKFLSLVRIEDKVSASPIKTQTIPVFPEETSQVGNDLGEAVSARSGQATQIST